MAIPTEPIGSIPRPRWLIEAAGDLAAGRITAQAYGELADRAVREDGRCLTAEVTKVDQNYPDGRLLVVWRSPALVHTLLCVTSRSQCLL